MSTESNKALIQKWLDAWNRADLAAIDELFASDYTVNDVLVGPEGVKQAVQYLHMAFSSIKVAADDLVAEGDKVVVRWTARGVSTGEFQGIAPSGKPMKLSGINIYRIANSRIASNHEQVDIEGLLRQLQGQNMV